MMGQYFMPYLQPPIVHPSMLSSHPSTLRAEKNPYDYPDISIWFQYLDMHQGRNRDDIVFEPLGLSLVEKGFVCITQLASDLIGWKDLQEWLDVTVHRDHCLK
jgi:hypothetical protein